jgi:hypothetical protein
MIYFDLDAVSHCNGNSSTSMVEKVYHWTSLSNHSLQNRTDGLPFLHCTRPSSINRNFL